MKPTGLLRGEKNAHDGKTGQNDSGQNGISTAETHAKSTIPTQPTGQLFKDFCEVCPRGGSGADTMVRTISDSMKADAEAGPVRAIPVGIVLAAIIVLAESA